MKIAIRLFAVWAAVLVGNSASAQDRDGLNHELKQALYTEKTAFVATLDLAALTQNVLQRTVRGFFEPASLAIVNQAQPGFEKQALDQVSVFATLAASLVEWEIPKATVVGLDHQGRRVFAGLPLPEKYRETFPMAKSPLELFFRTAGLDVQLSQFDDMFLVNKSGAMLPSPAIGYSGSVEQAVLAGLGQARGAPSINAVVPTSEAVRALLLASPGAANEIAKALGDADYVGGYAVTGDRPELHFYARFSGEAKANAVKKIYDDSWNQQMEAGKVADEQHANDIKEGKIHTVWYITWTEMYSRLRAASSVQVFGGVVLLNLETPDLHEITGALVDGFFRKP